MIGRTLGRYRFVERIGAGGMGVVYRARDERLDREVAVKVLPETRLADAQHRRRFQKEATALSRLNHPNIATVHDFETIDGTDCLVMECIPGETLRDRLERGPLDPPVFVDLATQFLKGLAAAHAEGVLHRDLKPGNVRITPDGFLKILDFGLASLAGGETTRSASEHAFAGAGTAPYMAPEQVKGEPIDRRADIYSAGATLYEMATGQRLFPGARGLPLLEAILTRAPDPPSALNPQVTAPLDLIILKALDKDPARRYQSAQEMVVDLRRYADGASAPAPPHRRWLRPVLAAAGAIVLVTLAMLGLRRAWAPPVLPERGWVLLADFDNQSGDAQLDEPLREGLQIALQQSQYVNVFGRDRVAEALGRMQRPSSARVDEATGLELCRRENLQLMLAGGVTRSGDATQIVVKALAPTGRLLFAETAQFTRKEDLFDRVDTIARRTRHNLGESLARIDRSSAPLAKVTTPSFEALQQYSQAVSARARGEMGHVETALRTALTLDPEFAMAHLKLGDYYEGVVGDVSRAQTHYAAAYARRDRVTDRERHLISAAYFTAREQYAQARDSLGVLVSLYPDDPEFLYELALSRYSLGDLRGAIADTRESIARDPYAVRVHGSLILFLAQNNEPERAVSAYGEATARKVDSPYLLWGLGLAEWGRNDLARARQAFERLRESGGFYESLGRLHLARLAIYEGQLDRATSELRDGLRVSREQGTKGMELLQHFLLARIHLVSGRREAARREAQTLLGAGGEALKLDELRRAGSALAQAGDLAAARQVLDRIAARRAAAPGEYGDFSFQALTGEIALAEGRTADALAAFELAVATPLSYQAWSGLARTRERRSEATGAAPAWAHALASRGQMLQDGFPLDWGLGHLALARTAERLGDRTLACRSYAAVEALWRDGTLTTPWREAAGRLRQLNCGSITAPGTAE